MSLFLPIPPLFHSVYSGEAFERCLDCECELHSHESFYTIQKFVVAGETVFEMALCHECRAQLYVRFSQESQATIQRFITERRALAQSREAAGELKTNSSEEGNALERESSSTGNLGPDIASLDSLQACVLCLTPKTQLRRFALVGLFLSDEILVMRSPPGVFPLPCLVCDQCNSGLDGMLSKQTRDEWNDFVEEHFPGPPGIELDSPKQTPLLV